MRSERLSWIGEDPASQKLFELAQRVAAIPTTILITGESGTGKEYLARLIHEMSPMRDAPYLKTECANLPAALVESELFGHERGAFPGAMERRSGLLELARRGTVVLEDLEALGGEAQQRLAQLLRTQNYDRIGGREGLKAECRIIAVSSADFAAESAAGNFRMELRSELEKVSLWVPPLRERRGDILPLVEHFLKGLREREKKPEARLGEKARPMLQHYSWPGNVPELRGVLEQAFGLAGGGTIEPEHLPGAVRRGNPGAAQEANLPSLEDLEREAIAETLRVTGYQIGRSAQILGISRKTLLEKRKKFGME